MTRQLLHKTLLIFLFIFCFTTFSGFSQENQKTYDSLKLAWKDSSYDELVSFFRKGNRIFDTLQMHTATEFILIKAKQKNRAKYYVRGYLYLAILEDSKGNYKEAITHIDKTIKYLNDADDYKNKAGVYLTKGNIHKRVGEYEKAMESYLTGLELAKIQDGEIGEVIQYSLKSNIALLKSIVYDTQGALEMHFENLKLLEVTQNQRIKKSYEDLKISALIGIAKAYSDLRNYKEAILYCNKVLENSKLYKDKEGEVFGLMGLGNIYSLTGEYKKAIDYLNEAEKTENSITKDYLDTGIYLYRARAFYFLKNYKETINQLDVIEKLNAKNNFNYFYLQEMYVLYAKIYKELGDKEKTIEYFDKTLEVFKENDVRKTKINEDLIKRYNLNSLQKEIDQLSESTGLWNSLISLILIIGCFIIVSFFIFYNRQKKKNQIIFDRLIIELNKESKNIDAPSIKKEVPKIEDKKLTELLNKLEIFEKEKQFIDRDITLSSLAKKINTNTLYLSKIINTNKKQSFIQYLTELRINYALQRLKEDFKLRSYTIDAIAHEVGFNNVSTFVKAFKTKTGIKPSYYIKELEKVF